MYDSYVLLFYRWDLVETGLFIGSFHTGQATFLFGALFGACAEWY